MRSIICADDDRYLLSIYERIFSDRGYDIRLYSDGKYVMDAYRDRQADLLILDIDMPGESGLEVCRKMRRDPNGYDLPIIIVSSHDTEDSIVNALSAGADDYIIKPFKPAELIAKTTSVIKKRTLVISKEMGLPVGSLFAGRYEILNKIGSGGFSNVFFAKDKDKGDYNGTLEVALKVFETPHSQKNSKEFMSRFLREAYGLSKLDHPNIVNLHNFGNSHHYYFLAMEYLRGRTLHEIIKKNDPMTQEEVAMVGMEVISTLQYMAMHEIIHRDIKPNNVMIVNTGDVKIIDFGLAKLVKDETVSLKEMFTGTPQFAAPEVIRMQRDVDFKSDIFSLGATLYYIATKTEPFWGDNSQEVFNNRFKLNPSPKPLSETGASLTPGFINLIEKMMSMDKENRPSTDEIKRTLASMIPLSLD